MKKKFLALVCMITCVFGLTACGEAASLSEYEQQKVEVASEVASTSMLPILAEFFDDSVVANFKDLTLGEIEYIFNSQYGLNVDGYAIMTAAESFHSAKSQIGDIQGIGDVEAKIDGKKIVVDVEVEGTKKNAIAEIIISNDRFFTLESASLNPESSMGELMGKAGLNTLIGMFTVFAVLILISFIISGFSIIPKLQANSAAKKAAKTEEEKAGINNAVAQIAAQEEVVDETDDLELVAVIAAAIAASEGAASTDGFVVRSIRRRA